jgi:hypothetical protein
VTTISQAELVRIIDGICDDRDSIIKHNPLGTDEGILLWMLLACLTSYLNLSEQETPCFTGMPVAETYREAIRFVLTPRRESDFDIEPILAKLSQK